VVREAENLGKAWAREFSLIGQYTTSYGEDLRLRDGLAHSCKTCANQRFAWLRFLYATDRVTRILYPSRRHRGSPMYMDMPRQHASRTAGADEAGF